MKLLQQVLYLIPNTSPTHPDPKVARDYRKLFQLPEGLSSQNLDSNDSSSSSSSNSNSPLSYSNVARSSTTRVDPDPSFSSPILPEASTSSGNSSNIERSSTPPIAADSSTKIERPTSPTGSEGSNETVVRLSYTDDKGKNKFILPRRS